MFVTSEENEFGDKFYIVFDKEGGNEIGIVAYFPSDEIGRCCVVFESNPAISSKTYVSDAWDGYDLHKEISVEDVLEKAAELSWLDE